MNLGVHVALDLTWEIIGCIDRDCDCNEGERSNEIVTTSGCRSSSVSMWGSKAAVCVSPMQPVVLTCVCVHAVMNRACSLCDVCGGGQTTSL